MVLYLGWGVASSWSVLEALLRPHLLNIELFRCYLISMSDILFCTGAF